MTELTQSPWIQIALGLFVGWVVTVSLFSSLRVISTEGRLRGSAAISVTVSVVSSLLTVIVYAVARGGFPGRWFFIAVAVAAIPGLVMFFYLRERARKRGHSVDR